MSTGTQAFHGFAQALRQFVTPWLRRVGPQSRVLGGMVVGAAVTWLCLELPYVNWDAVAPPLETRPLVIRSDAKGQGEFLAPRSGRRRHQGVDLIAPLNTPVRAIRSGVVIMVGTHRGLGRFVEVQHPGHLRSRYAHLEQVDVSPGQRVRQGVWLGTVGKTGNARHPWITPHLHLEVLKDGEAINPLDLGLSAVLPPARHASSDHVASDS